MIDDRIKTLVHRLATEPWIPAQAQRWIAEVFRAMQIDLGRDVDALRRLEQEFDTFRDECYSLERQIFELAQQSPVCPTCRKIARLTEPAEWADTE